MQEESPIRAEDFRKAWPSALARALREVSDLTVLLDEQRAQIIRLAQVTPRLLAAAELRLAEATQKGVDSLNTAQAEVTSAHDQLIQAQARFMKSFENERIALERARRDADVQMASIQSKTAELNAQRKKFNSRSLFSRVFARV